MGDATAGPGCRSFTPQLHVEFWSATVTPDARTGCNAQFPLADLVRQSVYGSLAGYEETA